eukprot:6210131-Pleurochrysis_carterae.AAC.2
MRLQEWVQSTSFVKCAICACVPIAGARAGCSEQRARSEQCLASGVRGTEGAARSYARNHARNHARTHLCRHTRPRT